MTNGCAPQAVLWDFDGTLVNSEPMWFEHQDDILARYGARWPEQKYHDLIGAPAMVTATHIAESCGGAISPDEVYEELVRRICKRFAAGEIPWLPGAHELLTEIRAVGVPCAVVTASEKRIMTVVAEVLPEFEFIIDGDDVVNPKPDPEGYALAIQRLGLTSQDVLILEDSVPGTAAASATGAAVLAVPLLSSPTPAPRRVIREGGLAGLQWEDLCEIWRSQW